MEHPPSSASSRRSRTTSIVTAVLLLVALGLGSCSKTDKPTLEGGPATSASTSTSTKPTTTSTPSLDRDPIGPDNLLGYIATPVGDPQVFDAPNDDATKLPIDSTSPQGAPMTFAVVGDPGPTPTGWLRVVLPTRPNDATGYVEADTVTITHTALRVFVDLSGRSLKVMDGETEVKKFEIAIGTEQNPTPTGAAFVTELLETPTPNGAYGPYAFGLSIHSDTLSEFGGGDGQVGIHGTNQPQLIGDAVSHGCVRLRNEDIRALVDLQVPLGMPVFVT